jgi:hypothetical protein
MVCSMARRAIRIESDEQPAVVSRVVEDGRISRIDATANPHKLTRPNDRAELVR